MCRNSTGNGDVLLRGGTTVGGTGVPPTSISATEDVFLQYKLVKKYFNRIYCTE